MKRRYPLPKDKKSRQFRVYYPLATHLLLDDKAENCKTLLITSTARKEGKTFTTINLGFNLALRQKRVLIVDVNPWNPMLTRRFHLERDKGFFNCLEEGTPLTGVQPLPDIEGFHVLGVGDTASDEIQLMHEKLNASLFPENYDFILLDTPSINHHYEARLCAAVVTGIILVVRSRKTQVNALVEANKKLQSSAGKLKGIVLNYYRNPIPKILLKLLSMEG
jgi:Mrp family chromosome partitioning ATPase